MNNALEFLGCDEKEEETFPEQLLEEIIKVLKKYSIYEYKILSNKIFFKFCELEYIIVKEREYKYRIKMGSGLTMLQSPDELIMELIKEFDYRRKIINGDMVGFSGHTGITGPIGMSGCKGEIATGCPGTEWQPDPKWNNDNDNEVEIFGQEPVIYCPYIPVTVIGDD